MTHCNLQKNTQREESQYLKGNYEVTNKFHAQNHGQSVQTRDNKKIYRRKIKADTHFIRKPQESKF